LRAGPHCIIPFDHIVETHQVDFFATHERVVASGGDGMLDYPPDELRGNDYLVTR